VGSECACVMYTEGHSTITLLQDRDNAVIIMQVQV